MIILHAEVYLIEVVKMGFIKIFDKLIEYKDFDCSLNGGAKEKNNPYVNLFVRTNDACNANCSFCEFHKKETKEFDIYKFYYILDYLKNKKVYVNKINFTGGEPTLYWDNLVRIVKMAKNKHPRSYLTLNTNGFNLERIEEIISILNSVSVSRHHYDMDKDKIIFKTNNFISNKKIANFPNKNKLHLRCNLIKGYIDNEIEIKKYIEFFSDLGVIDFGFVSLMLLNDFCKENFVDFKDLDIKFSVSKERTEELIQCSCRNFLYTTEKGNMVKLYSRWLGNCNANYSTLVYDVDTLTYGFGGEKIW